MKLGENTIPLGTIVFLREAMSFLGYGVVVDVDFWKEEARKENSSMVDDFNASFEIYGAQIIPIMLLNKKIGYIRKGNLCNNSGFTGGEYLQQFIWSDSTHLICFENWREFLLTMEQVRHLASTELNAQIKLIIKKVKEIGNYLEDEFYLSELDDIFERAFPREMRIK